MRAVRFGSYSTCATLAGTPSLFRLKSTWRYRRLLPPPRCGRLVLANGHRLLPCLEDLDRIAGGERDDRALLVGALALRPAAALRLAPAVQRVHGGHTNVPDLLDRLLDLRLVRARVDEERVRVLLDPRVGLLAHDRADDDVARGLHSASPPSASAAGSAFAGASAGALPSTVSSASCVNSTRSAATTSYTPTLGAYAMRICGRLRKDFSTAASTVGPRQAGERRRHV